MLGRKTTAHAHGADGMKAALKAGVDAIEHGTFMDDEITEMMLARGTVYVPTTLAGATVAEQAKTSDFMPAAIRRKALEVGPQILETLARGHKAGLNIAFGTDTGVSPHGENAKEFALMVKAGMTPMEAIKAATVSAAAHIGQPDHLGSIEPGKDADIIAVDRDPLADIEALMHIAFVMKARRGVQASPSLRSRDKTRSASPRSRKWPRAGTRLSDACGRRAARSRAWAGGTSRSSSPCHSVTGPTLCQSIGHAPPRMR